jgi:hypothetical protein
VAEAVYKNRKSYFLFERVSSANAERLKALGVTEGFVPVFLDDHEGVAEAYSKISHCMGLIVQGPLEASEASRVRDFEKLSLVRSEVISEGDDPVAIAQRIIGGLFPNKLKELCAFSVSKIFPLLVPGSSSKWIEAPQRKDDVKADFMVSCETLAEHFMGNISIRGGFSHLRTSSQFFSDMSDDEILNFCAEVGNEVLGVINFNLLKARIAAQVTLPMMIRESDGTILRRRSSYFLPSFSLKDTSTGLLVSFQFLVPFLKDATFDRELAFEVGWKQEENIELF